MPRSPHSPITTRRTPAAFMNDYIVAFASHSCRSPFKTRIDREEAPDNRPRSQSGDDTAPPTSPPPHRYCSLKGSGQCANTRQLHIISWSPTPDRKSKQNRDVNSFFAMPENKSKITKVSAILSIFLFLVLGAFPFLCGDLPCLMIQYAAASQSPPPTTGGAYCFVLINFVATKCPHFTGAPPATYILTVTVVPCWGSPRAIALFSKPDGR